MREKTIKFNHWLLRGTGDNDSGCHTSMQPSVWERVWSDTDWDGSPKITSNKTLRLFADLTSFNITREKTFPPKQSEICSNTSVLSLSNSAASDENTH